MRNYLTYALVAAAMMVAMALPLAAAAPAPAPMPVSEPNAKLLFDCLDKECSTVIVSGKTLDMLQDTNRELANENDQLKRLVAAAAMVNGELHRQLRIAGPRRCGVLQVLPETRKTSWKPT